MEEKEKFLYRYSSTENNEIRKIREKYEFAENNNSKIEQLKKLDKSVSNYATAVSLVLGIIGTLTFGFGMSCVLTQNYSMFVSGVIVGTIGLIILFFCYPAYLIALSKKEKRLHRKS